MGSPDDFRIIAKAALEGLREDESSHPAAEEWLAYVRGELAAGSIERLRRHLSLCAECTQLVLDLADLKSIDSSAGAQGSARDLEQAWSRLMARLETGQQPKAPVPSVQVAGASSAVRPRRREWLIAAGFAIIILGLSIWLLALHREVARLRGPRADLWVVDLRPVTEGTVRGAEAEEILRAPVEANQLVVILGLADVRSYSDYRVELLDSEERVLWSRSSLARTPEGSLILAFPLRFLPAGTGRIRLFGRGGEGDEERLIARYRFRIERPAG